jgi:hypothetical protein
MILLLLVAMLMMAGTSLAMSSTNYWSDWFTPMTGGGGGPATVGQTVVGASTSEHYGSGLGYWYGLLSDIFHNFLALVMKN